MSINIKLATDKLSPTTPAEISNGQLAVEANHLHVYYGNFRAVKDVNLRIETQKITAMIGPSGCGKSTVIRAFNRMNDLVPIARTEGEVLFHGQNIQARGWHISSLLPLFL